MSLSNEKRVEQLRDRFEGREAIYVEKGALRVKVTDIRGDAAKLYISAQVEEIPTPGLPVGFYWHIRGQELTPQRWSIGAGFLTRFSEHTWHMGYGGWALFFAPKIVDGVLNLALGFPDELDPSKRYREVLRYLQDHEAYEPTQ